MAQVRPGRSSPAEPEWVEGAERLLPRVEPLAVWPTSRIRSPIVEHRLFEPLPGDEYRPTFLLPPLRVVVDPARFALLVAVPLLLLVTWQIALVGAAAAVVAREVRRRVDRITFTFAEGMLPYRADMGWPHGVREDDDIHWNWSPVRDAQSAPRGHVANT